MRGRVISDGELEREKTPAPKGGVLAVSASANYQTEGRQAAQSIAQYLKRGNANGEVPSYRCGRGRRRAETFKLAPRSRFDGIIGFDKGPDKAPRDCLTA
jgi:hypothetical protein